MPDQCPKRGIVYSGLGKPDGLRLSMEPSLEIGYSPENLCLFVSFRGQRQDDVIVNLSDRIPVTKSLKALPIGFDDLPVDRRPLRFDPGKKGGTEIEADGGIIVEDV